MIDANRARFARNGRAPAGSSWALVAQAGELGAVKARAFPIEQLDDAVFEAAWAEGRAMSLEQAVAYALGGDDK